MEGPSKLVFSCIYHVYDACARPPLGNYPPVVALDLDHSRHHPYDWQDLHVVALLDLLKW